jgi:hypothetical protein
MCSNVCGQICNVEERLELFETGEVGCFRGQLVPYRDDSFGEKMPAQVYPTGARQQPILVPTGVIVAA